MSKFKVEVTCHERTEIGEVDHIMFNKKKVLETVKELARKLEMKKGDPYHAAVFYNGELVTEKDAVAE